LLKAVLKKTFYLAYLYSGYVQIRDLALAMLGRSRIVLLTYHRLDGCDGMTKPLADFRRDVDYLSRKYRCLTFYDLAEKLRSNSPLRRTYRGITFDDGYRDNFTVAFPVLRAARLPATFFVSTGFIGSDSIFPHDAEMMRKRQGSFQSPSASRPNMTWDDLRAMQAAGYEIGSHTVNHVDLGCADEQTIFREIEDSLAALNTQLGERQRAFSFPFGQPDNIPEAAIHALRTSGFYAAASQYGGVNQTGTDPFRIRRVDVGNGNLTWLEVRSRMAGFDPDYFRWWVRSRSFRLKTIAYSFWKRPRK
jgi:peptidoglycan/xylan/chitin deacetylase (PgdA/CDA1 family)